MSVLETLVQDFVQDDQLELEMCLCVKRAKDEPTKLPQDMAYKMMTTLSDSAKEGHFKATKHMFVDYFYQNGTIRHRCFVESTMRPETVRKTRIGRALASCPQRDYNFCFNLKREQPIRNFNTIEQGAPEYIRIQQEWVFEYKNAFRYVVKQVQSGGTSKEECLNKPLHFEIEIELLHDSDYIKQRSIRELTESFIEKCLDLCGRKDDNDENPEPLTMIFEKKRVKK